MQRITWTRVILRKLTNNPEMVKVYVIPGLLFLLDLVLRAVLGIDLIDIGADMALLAVATFVSLLVEDVEQSQYHATVMIVFIMIFLALWIICLSIISVQSPISFLMFNFRPMLSWFVGLTSFIFSCVLANEIVQENSDSMSE